MVLSHWLRCFSRCYSSRRLRRTSDRRRRQSVGYGSNLAAESLETRTLLSAGAIDFSFSNDGFVNTPIPDALKGAGSDVAIQDDGKIVAVGHRQVDSNNQNNDFVVARYNPDGSLDTSFGNSGMLVGGAGLTSGKARAVTIDDQGRILIAGSSGEWGGRVIRLLNDGSLDATFDGDGIHGFGRLALNDIMLQPDGKIVVAGEFNPDWSVTGERGDYGDFGIVRLNVDGSLDTSFSGDGFAQLDFSTPDDIANTIERGDRVRGLDIDSSGRIIVAGDAQHQVGSDNLDFAVARYNPDGTLDASFGSAGALRIDVSAGFAHAVSVDTNGKIVLAGRTANLVRLNDDGSFDSTFGGGDGMVMTTLNEFRDVVLQDDGKIIASGNTSNQAAAFRFNTDGTADIAFGINGSARIEPGGNVDWANGVALQQDGKVVIVGFNANDDDPPPQIGVARFLGDNLTPEIAAQIFDVNENETLVGMVAATDDDLPDDSLTFAITNNGADDALFSITADGELSFITAPDYENPLDANGDNVYEVEVEVTDSVGASALATMTVNVLNQTATISGTVFADVDGDGLFDGGTESAIDGVIVELLDSMFGTVDADVTELGGVYAFTVDDEMGTYRIRETQPNGVDDGEAILGNAGGTVISSNEMELTLAGADASDYDFTEIGQAVQAGDTATIGFWQNKHGQELIAQGGPALVEWLNSNFGNVFGTKFSDGSGGDDSSEVASFYRNEFFKKKVTGTSKVDAQFMATAFATFFTSSNLSGGTVAADYGFNVTETGIGTKVVNVGANGAAFEVASDTDMTIMSLLLATNRLTDNDGLLNNDDDGYSRIYDIDGDGILSDNEKSLRAMANDIYSAINVQGDI